MDESVAEEGAVEEVVDTEAGEESGLLTDQAATEIKLQLVRQQMSQRKRRH